MRAVRKDTWYATLRRLRFQKLVLAWDTSKIGYCCGMFSADVEVKVGTHTFRLGLGEVQAER